MKPSPRPQRVPGNLSKSVLRRLDFYALAAGAAGIGMTVQPAEAKIIYTPAHVPIVGIVSVDLNHDSITDFKFGLRGYSGEEFLEATSLAQNRVRGSTRFASHLLAGVRIGPNQKKFTPGHYCGSTTRAHTCKDMNSFFFFSGQNSSRGTWAGTTKGYLGLKFYIKGKVHFGWARFQRQALNDKWILTGYAYETVVGESIIAGRKRGPKDVGEAALSNPAVVPAPDSQSVALGMLALGAPGLSIWRREQPVGTRPQAN
jgi:hypothetical protein